MGIVQGTLKSQLVSQRGNLQCVPRQCYQPFPEERHHPGEGGLVLQIQALPSSLGEVFNSFLTDPKHTRD